MYLFNRSISVNVRSDDARNVTIEGILIDSHHELCLTINIDAETNTIVSAEGELRRAPFEDCKQTQLRINNLAGINLILNAGKQIRAAVGGKNGCTHLTELSLECIKGYLQSKSKLMEAVMNPDDVKIFVDKYLEGSCLHYNKP
jgi:hypothetical protein